jgi:sugar lactone lactonase YvrE
VADNFNYAIRKITPEAVVTTFATGITFPAGLTLDKDGNIFVSSGYFIDKVSPTGEVAKFAGGTWGSEDGVGLEAQFSLPQRITIDRTGNLYVSDAEGVSIVWANETIRKITPDAVVTTFCAVSTMGSHDGVGTKARFFWPRGVAATQGGTLYVADTNNSTLRKIAPNGLVTTIAGKVQTPGYVDGSASDARFNYPRGLALDKEGNLFVADQGNNVIRKMTPDGQVSTIANGYNFSAPYGMAIDRHGNIYVSAGFNQTIDKVTPEGTVTILAGSPGQSGYQDGIGEDARFNIPAGLALDASGNIFVADLYNNSIRKVTPTGVVTTLAGSLRAGSNDGIGSDASFRNPSGVAVDRAGNVYVGDYANSTLRKVTPEGSVTTLAGSPKMPNWIDGTGDVARLNSAEGVAVDDAGNVYFADVGNDSIRKAVPTSQ